MGGGGGRGDKGQVRKWGHGRDGRGGFRNLLQGLGLCSPGWGTVSGKLRKAEA